VKLLVIAYSFPPIVDAQSIRWAYLTKELINLGLDIDILTIKLPPGFEDEFKIKYPSVYRIFPGPFEYIFYRAKSRIGVNSEGNVNKRRNQIFIAIKKVYRGFRSLLNSLLIPDIRTEWLPFVLWFINKKIDIRKYDVVITSHEPGVDSIAGLYLKRKYPKIKWVADFGDPFVAPYTPKIRRWLDRLLEEKIYKKANKIIFTSEKVKYEIIKQYPKINCEKIYILPQGFDNNFALECNSYTPNNKELTFCFTGTFYKNSRDPSQFVKALSELKHLNFKILLAGRNEIFLEKFEDIKDKVQFFGMLPHRKSLEIQKKTDVLIHITNKYDMQIPGKLYEYFGACRAILCITYNNNDEGAMLVKNLNRGEVVANRKEDIKQVVLKMYNCWKKGDFSKNYDLGLLSVKDFSWQKLAKNMYRIIIH